MNALAVGSIGLYQRYISPYKGFRCAIRALDDGLSCSEYGKRAFARYSAAIAWKLLKRRLEHCRATYSAFQAARTTATRAPAVMMANTDSQPTEDNGQKPSKSEGGRSCDALSNAGSCVDAGDLGACACDSLGLLS